MARKDAKNYVLDTETGKYDYIGMRYYVMADEKDFKRFKRWGLLASLALVALFLGTGMIMYGGMYCIYVQLPNVLMVIGAFVLCYQMMKLFGKQMELTEAANRRLMHVHWASLMSAICGGLAAAGHVLYSVLNGWQQGDVIFIVLTLLSVPLGILVFLLARKCPTEPLLIDDVPQEDVEEIPGLSE